MVPSPRVRDAPSVNFSTPSTPPSHTGLCGLESVVSHVPCLRPCPPSVGEGCPVSTSQGSSGWGKSHPSGGFKSRCMVSLRVRVTPLPSRWDRSPATTSGECSEVGVASESSSKSVFGGYPKVATPGPCVSAGTWVRTTRPWVRPVRRGPGRLGRVGWGSN